ncbi:unnamed protein product [Taenia asiatica]|uniref:Sodium-dependent multivitamin transporter n=1 Tax=Taenia asiatica TaxID=60517 RepID=A0A0R3W0H2_TAEAS|nr:unnamed protein product [Taenia asiatica]
MLPAFQDSKVAGILYYGLCTPFVGCLCLGILWARLSKAALLIGYFVSAAGSLTLWFVFKYATSLGALQTPHAFSVHLDQSDRVGSGILGGCLLPALITLLHTKAVAPELARGVWDCVQEINNPLVPWPEVFTR